MTSVVTDLDGWQRRHPVIGFPVAVFKRYGEDHGGWLGAVVTYYGFFALAPLMAVVMTLVAAAVDDPTRRERFVTAISEVLPFISPAMQQSLSPIVGNPLTVAVGVLIAFWGGANAIRISQETMNQMWGVPRYQRPSFVRALIRGVGVLVLLGVGLVSTAVVAGFTLGQRLPLAAALVSGVMSCALNTAIALVLFRLLVTKPLAARQVLPGAVLVGISAYALTLAGGLYVQRVVARASSLYGSFATVVGLFAWIALLVQTLVYGTLVNVVRVERLWPRSITGTHFGDADRRAAELTSTRAALVASIAAPPEP